MTEERHMDNSEPTPGKSPGQDQAETATPSVGDIGEVSKNLPPTYTTGPGQVGGVRPGEALSPEKDDTSLEATTAAVQSATPEGPVVPITEAEAAEREAFSMSEIAKIRSKELTPEIRPKFEAAFEVMKDPKKSVDETIDALREGHVFSKNMDDRLIREMLGVTGRSEADIDEIMRQKDKWAVSEEMLRQEGEEPLDTQAELEKVINEEEAKDMIGEIKDMQAKIDRGEISGPEAEQEVEAFKEEMRGRLGRWLDKNPGKLHKVNRLLVRPGVAALLMLAIIYLSLLSVATKSATAKVGGK